MNEEVQQTAGDSVSLRASRDQGQYEKPLLHWFSQNLPESQGLEIIGISAPDTTGSSSELIMVDLEWRNNKGIRPERYVIRLEPTENTLLRDVNMRVQFELPRAIARSGDVPVANMRWFEPSKEIFGTSFFVMDRIEGVPPADIPPYNAEGWLAEASPEFREKIWWRGIDVLLQLHTLEVENSLFAPFRKADSARGELEAEIAYYESFYHWAREDNRYSLVEEGLRWLKSNLPEESAVRLCWGDSRLGNMMFDPDTGECLAVLDWEMFSFGVPEKDLAYWIWSDRFFSEGLGATRLPGWPSYPQTMAYYEKESGYKLSNMEFYDLLAPMRNLIIYIRLINLYKKMGKSHALLPGVEDVYTAHWIDQILHG